MKPAQFEYYDPTTLSEALDLLAELGDRARPLAGGQSLVPLMNLRLVRPSHLIDLNQISELRYLRMEDRGLCVGAMARQRELERSAAVAEHWPLLKETTTYIGHVQIRNRGTVGGSIAHAYPSAELPVAMTALDATFVLRGKSSERTVPAGEFFVSYMTTALKPTELLVEIRVPRWSARTGWAFQEVSRRHGDFALMGAAALLTLDEAGVVQRARVVLTGPTPLRSHRTEEVLVGQRADEKLFREAARSATKDLDFDSDIHASADYRRQVGEVLARRALEQAARRALDREL